jgi:hypothetical protein
LSQGDAGKSSGNHQAQGNPCHVVILLMIFSGPAKPCPQFPSMQSIHWAQIA